METHIEAFVKSTALGYIQKVYPTKDITEDQVSKLLDLVYNDIIRIQDPILYINRVAIVAGNNYSSENRSEIDDAIAQLRENGIL